MAKGRKLSVPMAKPCGDVALKQISGHRHFMLEQPHGSGLFEEPQSQQLCELCFKVVFDQCMVGLKMSKFPLWPVRKTTEAWASSACLYVWHAHIGSWSRDEHPTARSSDMQVWPHELCQRFAAGIIRQMKPSKPVFSFLKVRLLEIACPGCKGHIRKEDPWHDRGPTCPFRDVQPVVWACDGCKHNRRRSHTNGPDCRWSVARTVAEGASSCLV